MYYDPPKRSTECYRICRLRDSHLSLMIPYVPEDGVFAVSAKVELTWIDRHHSGETAVLRVIPEVCDFTNGPQRNASDRASYREVH
jgi:hypothetical protein